MNKNIKTVEILMPRRHEQWDGTAENDRRGPTVTDLLIKRIDGLEKFMKEGLAEVNKAINEHITSCNRLQKWGIGFGAFIAAWVVLHGPEVQTLPQLIKVGAKFLLGLVM